MARRSLLICLVSVLLAPAAWAAPPTNDTCDGAMELAAGQHAFLVDFAEVGDAFSWYSYFGGIDPTLHGWGPDLFYTLTLVPGQSVTALTFSTDSDMELFLVDRCALQLNEFPTVSVYEGVPLEYTNETAEDQVFYLILNRSWGQGEEAFLHVISEPTVATEAAAWGALKARFSP